MEPRFLRHYNRELQYIREMGAEFAQEFPKIAGRLGLEGFECADPYVERLLEGFAFLAARIQFKLDAEFPRFTQHLLEAVYPHYLAPTPSMAVVQLQPDLTEGALAEGFTVPRDSILRGILGKGDRTACEYRTAHNVSLWPLQLTKAEYLPTGATLARAGIPDIPGSRAGIRLCLRTTAGLTFNKIALDTLNLYVRGSEELPMHIYEQLFANGSAVVVRPSKRTSTWHEVLDKRHVKRVGFGDEEALLPIGPQSFQGYRLLHEYFSFPARFMFVELTGLASAVQRCEETEMEVVVVLDRSDPDLEDVLDVSHFALFSTPAINLFPKRADRIHLDARQHEYHLVPDRTRPMDLEVHSVNRVLGHGTRPEHEQAFHPLYALQETGVHRQRRAYYVVRRERRMLSARQRLKGPRSSYVGSEMFLTLVDADEAPYSPDLKQLSLSVLCTNRDLPLHMPVGKGKTDFTLESGAPVDAVRIVSGPSAPRTSWAEGDPTWRLISHLTPNYLSLLDKDDEQGAAALRELLTLYSDVGDAASRSQIEGVRSVQSVPVTRRLPLPGPISFGRGLQITVTCDEIAFEGAGVFLLGAVLERYFARYVSINSFTETVLRTVARGEIMRWTTRAGQRHLM